MDQPRRGGLVGGAGRALMFGIRQGTLGGIARGTGSMALIWGWITALGVLATDPSPPAEVHVESVDAPSQVCPDGERRDPSAAIADILRAHEPELAYCYRDARELEPELAGKLSVRMTIDTMGRTKAVEVVESPSLEVPLTRCIERAAAYWVFAPAYVEALVVTAHFRLGPR